MPRYEITDSEEDATTEEMPWGLFTQGSVVGRLSPDVTDCLTNTMAGKFTVRVPPVCRNTIPIRCVIPHLHYSILMARLHAG